MFMNDKTFILKNAPEPSDNGLIQVGTLELSGYDLMKRVYSPQGICPTLNTMTGGNRYPKFYFGETYGVRRLTPKEC